MSYLFKHNLKDVAQFETIIRKTNSFSFHTISSAYIFWTLLTLCMPQGDISAQDMQAQVAMSWYISTPRQKTCLLQNSTKLLMLAQFSKFKKLQKGEDSLFGFL